MKLFRQSPVLLFIFSMFFTQGALAGPRQSCRSVLSTETSSFVYVLSGKETSLRDLEGVFRRLSSGENFELIIPKKVKINLTIEPKKALLFAEQETDYFPYYLKQPRLEEDSYTQLSLYSFREALEKIKEARERGVELSETWKGHYEKKFFFVLSPAPAGSQNYFGNQKRVFDLINIVKTRGRRPFLYIKKNGDMVFTNKNLLKHLRASGQSLLTVTRTQASFDYFFYRLLLAKTKKEKRKWREQFADWIEENSSEFSRRTTKYSHQREAIELLRSKAVSTKKVLGEISRKFTTSLMFTSLTNNHSGYWFNDKDPLSETISLELDLSKIPDWYLDEIFYGNDLDIEMVFPYAAKKQREVLRASLSIR